MEINTDETSPARPHIRLGHEVQSPWWSGSADILTFEPAELVATKLRALYQRRKGRDLFDLWLALTQMGLESEDILACFGPYRPDGYTTGRRQPTSRLTSPTPASVATLFDLVGEGTDFDVDEAAALVTGELLARLDEPGS